MTVVAPPWAKYLGVVVVFLLAQLWYLDVPRKVLVVPESANDTRPNIIFFLADDLGFNDVPWNNPNLITPTLKALSQNGTVIKNFYTYQVCNPSRAALMTSYLQHHSHSPSLNTLMPLGLQTHFKIFPQFFKDLGYKTHLIGKWHLGFCNEKYLPTRRGFDSFYGYFSGGEDYYTHSTIETGIYDFYRDEKPDLEANGTYSTILFTKEAQKIINQHSSGDEGPFLIILAFQSIHGPLENPPFEDPFPDAKESKRKVARRMIMAMDDAMGAIYNALVENQIEDNTILAFTSDNGGDTCLGGNNYPLRGGKHTLWEGGIRVPAVIKIPQAVSNNRNPLYTGLFHMVDWLPTFFEAAGGDPAILAALDGVSHFRALRATSEGEASPRDEVHVLHGKKGLLRKGRYKLLVKVIYAGYAISPAAQENMTLNEACKVNEKRSEPLFNHDPILVYDIQSDPGETTPIKDPAVVEPLVARYNALAALRTKNPTPFNHTNSPYLLGKKVVEVGWC